MPFLRHKLNGCLPSLAGLECCDAHDKQLIALSTL